MAEDRMLSDEVLLALIKKNSGGGGGGGTDDYNDLKNQPQIGGNTLVGNKTASDLGLVAAESGKGLSSNDYTNEDKAIVGGVTAALADKADKSAVKNEFIGTTAEWNALTTAQKKGYDTYQLTDDYTEGSGGLPDYSTTEQKTGQKWIDGKDVYCKVYNNIQLSGNTDITVDNNLIHDSIVRITATVKDISGADTYITPFQSFGTLNNIGAIPRVINNRLSINCVGSVSGTATIIIEYTKA
jgi:hypothetical protein